MKRFRFALETLLDIKKRREEELARNLAKKNNEISIAQKQLREGHDRLREFQALEKRQRTAVLDAHLLRLSVLYGHHLQHDIEAKGLAIANLKQNARAILQLLTDAKKETRALEILREKKQMQWKRDYRREEQGISDDISQKGHIRRSLFAGKPKDR